MGGQNDERMMEVVEAFNRGLTYNQIAQKYGLSRGGVGGYLKRWRQIDRRREDKIQRAERQVPDPPEIREQREADRRFLAALARAFIRGDNIPMAEKIIHCKPVPTPRKRKRDAVKTDDDRVPQ